jgi:hypothetical protein
MATGTTSTSYSLVNNYNGYDDTFIVETPDNPLVASTKYKFVVTAVNSIDESDPSSEVIFTAASLPT